MAAGLRWDGLTAQFIIDDATDGLAIRTYAEKVLVPSLIPGDIVVMDNLPTQNNAKVGEMIEAAGCQLLYLPPCSPDSNPIEMGIS